MIRFIALVALATVLALGALLPRFARSAYACSAGPDFNPLAGAEVIVAGRVQGWEKGDEAAMPPALRGGMFVPVRVALHVEKWLKGVTPAEIIVVDYSSLAELSGRTEWAGASGRCGSFDADPTGQYAVMSLGRLADGTYGAHRLSTFYLGDAPAGPGYEWRMALLASYDPAGMLTARFGARALNCPVAADACAFATHVQQWFDRGIYDAFASLLQTQEVECPGPTPIGLGGPYPLCDGSQPGERRYGTPIVRPGSEGGIGSVELFRDLLARRATPMRLATIGCPDAAALGANACGDAFSLVFVAPDCPAQGGCSIQPVTVLPVVRQPSGQYRLASIITSVAGLLPDAALTGGRVSAGRELFVPGAPATATFVPWSPPPVAALPPAGHGLTVDTPASVTTAAILFAGAIAVVLLSVTTRLRRRG